MTKDIRQLLRKFMDGETTVDEERYISKWFRSHPDVDGDLADYRTMFGWFDDGMPMPKRRSIRLLRIVAVAASVALAVGVGIFGLSRWQHPAGDEASAPIAIAAFKKAPRAVTPEHADTATQAVPMSNDTIDTQIYNHEKKTGHRTRRVRFEPVPPSPLYANRTAEQSEEAAALAEAMEKANSSYHVTEESEKFVDAALTLMDCDITRTLLINDMQSVINEQLVTSAIEDGTMTQYYDDDTY